jgi:hypothetical protein
VVRQLYGHLPNKPLLWTAAHGGRWLAIGQCIFPDAACLQQQPFHLLTADEAQQSLLQHAPLQQQQQLQLQERQQDAGSSSSSDGLGPLGQALLLLDMPLLDMPAGVLLMMQKHLVCCLCGWCCCYCCCCQLQCLSAVLLRPRAYIGCLDVASEGRRVDVFDTGDPLA